MFAHTRGIAFLTALCGGFGVLQRFRFVVFDRDYRIQAQQCGKRARQQTSQNSSAHGILLSIVGINFAPTRIGLDSLLSTMLLVLRP
jgi:hypothetical protein